MYATNHATQASNFIPKVKLNAESKKDTSKVGRYPKFKDSFNLASQESLVKNQKKKLEELNKEGIPLSKNLEEQEEASLLLDEVSLFNQQMVMSMAIVNADDAAFQAVNQTEEVLVPSVMGVMEQCSEIPKEMNAMKLDASLQTMESNSIPSAKSAGEIEGKEDRMIPFGFLARENGMQADQSTKVDIAANQMKQTVEPTLVGKNSDNMGNSSLKTMEEPTAGEQMLDMKMDESKGKAAVPILDTMAGTKQEPLDFSKVNIKVGESIVNANSENLGQDIADKILYHTAEGKSEFELQLNPKDLGAIRIKLIFESGKAAVLLNCSNPKTQELLMGNADSIRHIIELQTGSETVVTVKEDASQNQQDLDGRGQNDRHEEQRQQQQNKDRTVNAELFLQQLKLGLVGKEDINYGG